MVGGRPIVEAAVGLELYDDLGVAANPGGCFAGHHESAEPEVDGLLIHLPAEAFGVGQLQQLELADLQQVGGMGDLRPLGVFLVVGMDQGVEKIHGISLCLPFSTPKAISARLPTAVT